MTPAMATDVSAIDALGRAQTYDYPDYTQPPKTAYVAGSSKQVDRVRRAMVMVRAAGYHIAFDWTGPDGEIRSHWGSDTRDRGNRIARLEIEAATNSDLYVLIAPPEPLGTGCFIEMGAALAAGKRCLVENSERRESVFFCHDLVTVVFSFEKIEEWLSSHPG